MHYLLQGTQVQPLEDREILIHLLDKYPEEACGIIQNKKGKLNNKEDISHGIDTAPKSLVKLLNGSNLGKQLVKV